MDKQKKVVGYDSPVNKLVGEAAGVGVESFQALSVSSLERMVDWLEARTLQVNAVVTAPQKDGGVNPYVMGSPYKHAYVLGQAGMLNALVSELHNRIAVIREEEGK